MYTPLQEFILSNLIFINVVIGMMIIFSFLEVLFPAENGQSLRGRIRNVVLTLMHIILGGAILALFTNYFAPVITVPSHESALRSLLSILTIIFVGDFLFYWYHRAQHSFKMLWQLHELHHSDTELNATSSMRSHFLERPIQFSLLSFPVAYTFSQVPFLAPLALDDTAAIVMPFLFTLWLFFNHANIRVQLGSLTRLFTGPQLHRLHHSIEASHLDTNFAQFFPIFDIVFGTYVAPKKNEFPETGTPDLRSDAPYSEMIFKPFRVWYTSLTKIR